MRQCLKILVAAILSTIGGGPGEAQHHGGPQPSTSHGQPYAGLQQRDVKALSDTQLADLRAGRGIGLALAAEALFQHTSRLQRFELTKPKAVIGKDTISALLSGAVLGHVALVEGLIARIRAELGSPAIVVATGELASLVAEQTDCIDRVEPWLAHVGLRLFYELNQGHHGHR